MTKITAKNARNFRDSFLKDLREESEAAAAAANGGAADDIPEGQDEKGSTDALAGAGDEGTTPEAGQGGEPGAAPPASPMDDGSATPSGNQPDGTKPADEYAALSREELVTRLKNTEKQRASIQRIITPTQEQNARMRERIKDLESEVKALKEASANAKPSTEKDPGPDLSAVGEVFPELVPILENLMKRKGDPGTDTEVQAIREELRKRDEMQEQDRRARIVGQIESAHPDARAIVASEGFLEWIDSHGDYAAVLRDQLENPWNYDPKATIELFNGYKREALASPASPSPAAPAAPAAAQAAPLPKTPTDVVPPSRPAPPVAPRAGGAAQKLNERQREDLLKELRSTRTKDSRKQEIKKLLLAG